MSEEEFHREAPPEISRPSLTKNDPHQLTLARLDWELEQRKRYANRHAALCSSLFWDYKTSVKTCAWIQVG